MADRVFLGIVETGDGRLLPFTAPFPGTVCELLQSADDDGVVGAAPCENPKPPGRGLSRSIVYKGMPAGGGYRILRRTGRETPAAAGFRFTTTTDPMTDGVTRSVETQSRTGIFSRFRQHVKFDAARRFIVDGRIDSPMTNAAVGDCRPRLPAQPPIASCGAHRRLETLDRE